MLSLHVYETIPFCRMVNSHFPMVEIPVPDISSSKTQSADLFCFSILMYSALSGGGRGNGLKVAWGLHGGGVRSAWLCTY